MNYENVIWDWNGTLLDDVDSCVESVNVSLSKRGMPTIDKKAYSEYFCFPVSEYYKILGFDFNKESYEILAEEFTLNYISRPSDLRLNAKKTLEKLFLNSVNQYVLSASEKNLLESGIKKFGIGCFFKAIIAQDNHSAAGKVEAGREFMRKNPLVGKTLMVGDTVHDYEVAKELGIDCVLIDSGNNSVERLSKTGAKIILDLKELPDIVLGKRNRKNIDYMTPEKAERRSFDLSEINRKFKENYRSFYNDVKNTNATEDW